VQLHARGPAEEIERAQMRRIGRVRIVRAALEVMLGRGARHERGGLDGGEPRQRHFVALRLRVLHLRQRLLHARVILPRPLLHVAERESCGQERGERDHSFV